MSARRSRRSSSGSYTDELLTRNGLAIKNMVKSFLAQLNWRFATKKYNPQAHLKKADLDKILKAIQYAPSSFGIQPYHIYVIADHKLRAQLKPVCDDQDSVTDSQYLLVFCTSHNLKQRVADFVKFVSKGDAEKIKKLQRFKKNIEEFHREQNSKERMEWSARQVYLALGFGLAACAELQIDSTPMEGFTTRGVAKVLKLPKDQEPVVLMAIGKRREGPARAKFRYPQHDLFTFI